MYKLIVVRFNRDLGTFDDSDFVKFCDSHQIVNIDNQFFNLEGNVYYSFFIEYLNPKKSYIDFKDLDEKGREQYDKLRDWRNEVAQNEGIPPYIILYNKQIVEIVKNRPKTVTDLELIRGFKNKAAKYGKNILKILGGENDEFEK